MKSWAKKKNVKYWAVGTQTKPQYERDDTNYEKKTQENGTYHLGDPSGEAFVDPMNVVASGVVAL